MFIIVTVADTIRIEPEKFGMRTMDAIHEEIDIKYPNRVLYDRGLVITRFGDVLEIGDGACVPGDGGAHYETIFRLVVFRPFVDEICTGRVIKCTEEGVQVTLGGFFDDIFIPGYWMLRPSHYDHDSKLWVWVPPNYDDDEGEGEGDKNQADNADEKENSDEKGSEVADGDKENDNEQDTEERFEVEIGAEIRFRVKSLHFTQVTNTAKGLQATMTTTSGGAKLFPGQAVSGGRGRSGSVGKAAGDTPDVTAGGGHTPVDNPVRKRSSSFDLTDAAKLPASFFIVASICEDGLGLTSWWTEPVDDDEVQDEDAVQDEDEVQAEA